MALHHNEGLEVDGKVEEMKFHKNYEKGCLEMEMTSKQAEICNQGYNIRHLHQPNSAHSKFVIRMKTKQMGDL